MSETETEEGKAQKHMVVGPTGGHAQRTLAIHKSPPEPSVLCYLLQLLPCLPYLGLGRN